MKLQQLRFFQAACKYNSITRAARELHISQPSVAQYYSDLALVPIRPPLIATISLVWLPQNSMSSDTELLIDYYTPKE